MPAPPYTFRSAALADAEALFRLDLLCFIPPFAFTREDFERYLCAPSTIALLAHDEEALTGFVIFTLTLRQQRVFAYVATLDVHPDHRRRGLAARLMQYAEREAAARGALMVRLHVWVENLPAIAFYEGTGYTRDQLIPGYYAPAYDALLLCKQLNPAPPSASGEQ